MGAAPWTWVHRLFHSAFARKSRARARAVSKRRTLPGLEPLEAVALLSAGGSVLSHAAAAAVVRHEHRTVDRHISHQTRAPLSSTTRVSYDPTPITLPEQTLSYGPQLTSFANEPLAPTLNLFNPSLGNLVSVTVDYSAAIQSNITSQNRSTTSGIPNGITATLTGSFEIDGLNEPISQPTTSVSETSAPQPPAPTPPVIFPTLTIADTSSTTYTDPASLAFFTASTGRTTATATMTATANATASATNGNLFTTTSTMADSTVNVIYTYENVCPTFKSIGRVGVHHQQTKLIVTFDGPVDPAKANDPDNYFVITRFGKRVNIKSATFNPATNSVTLIPVRRLNVHYHYKLSLVIPCANEMTPQTIIVPFGSKYDLIGFRNHRGDFVSVEHGRIVGYYTKSGTFVPRHHGKI
jgi:hypothetical protein